MLIDHVGVVFFPDFYTLRAIGRLSFPLFIWLLVQGEAHTNKVSRYLLRLCLLGILSQPIYQLTFEVTQLNILFTLVLGLICLRLTRRIPQLQLAIWSAGSVLAQVANLEYGAYGMVAIALTQRFQPSWQWWLGWLLFHFGFWVIMPDFVTFQIPAIATPLLFHLANQQQGARARWFYGFYPFHLLALFLIRELG
jgi:hypothetical protein